MLFREIMAVYYENHTKHKNILCGQNAEMEYYLMLSDHRRGLD
jgi:hypothetical protein